MKSSLKYLAICTFILLIWSCKDSNSSKKEATAPRELNEVEMAQQRFVEEVEAIHKKEKFVSEDIVGYEIGYTIGNRKDVLQIKAATDLKFIEVTSQNFGKAYYNGNQLYIDAMANMDDGEAKRIFQLVYFYHAFFHLKEDAYAYFPIESTTIMNENFKYISINNQEVHPAFFPKEVEFYIEDRTQMLKGLAIQTNQLTSTRAEEEIYVQFDRFITVNHVPVSLTWKIYPKNKLEESAMLGEAKITKIKYFDAAKLQLNLPEDAKPIKRETFL